MYDQARAASSLEKNMLEEPTELAKANSILETEMATDKVRLHNLLSKVDTYVHPLVQMAEMELNTAKNIPLVDRLDQYYEDPDLVKGKPNLVNFPPEFSPIPCKPLFYDVALYHVEMPSLDHKLEAPGAGAGAGGLGGWLGGWGWGKK